MGHFNERGGVSMSESTNLEGLWVVGERLIDKNLSESRVAWWRSMWERSPRIGVTKAPTMTTGMETRVREVLGIGWERTACLLPPVNAPERFDASRARTAVPHIEAVLEEHGARGVVILGSRVAEVMGLEMKAGQVVLKDGRYIMVLPHPSSRNKFWTNNGHVAKLKTRMRKAISRVEGLDTRRISPTIEPRRARGAPGSGSGKTMAKKKQGEPLRYMTTTEVAAYVLEYYEDQCSHDLVERDVREGRLKPDAVTGRVKGFLPSTVDAWWEARDVRPGNPNWVAAAD
jgi:hypothetical protein